MRATFWYSYTFNWKPISSVRRSILPCELHQILLLAPRPAYKAYNNIGAALKAKIDYDGAPRMQFMRKTVKQGLASSATLYWY